ncbi:MAG: hypothetical protein Q9228_008000, partial [Teloschistes exilis]
MQVNIPPNPPGKGCGFVTYDERSGAERAVYFMQGFFLDNLQIRVGWGSKQKKKLIAIDEHRDTLALALGLCPEQKQRLDKYIQN